MIIIEGRVYKVQDDKKCTNNEKMLEVEIKKWMRNFFLLSVFRIMSDEGILKNIFRKNFSWMIMDGGCVLLVQKLS